MRATLKHTVHLIYQNLEFISWIVIIILLLLPMPAEPHFTLCPLQNLGFDYCPGCGLGRSCNMALHGNILGSLSMHPFGIFAILVILHRIYTLAIFHINHFKTKSL